MAQAIHVGMVYRDEGSGICATDLYMIKENSCSEGATYPDGAICSFARQLQAESGAEKSGHLRYGRHLPYCPNR